MGDRRWHAAAAKLMHSGEARLIDDTATGFSLHVCQKNRLKNFSVICETGIDTELFSGARSHGHPDVA